MTYQLTDKQIRALESLVSTGEFASVEAALDAALASLEIDVDDLDWAIPLVAEAEAELARGKGIASAVVRAEADALLKSR